MWTHTMHHHIDFREPKKKWWKKNSYLAFSNQTNPNLNVCEHLISVDEKYILSDLPVDDA